MADLSFSGSEASEVETSLLRDEGIQWTSEFLATAPYGKTSSGRPLRVAVFTENFLPKIDGVTRTVARLLQHLRLAGHEAILFGPQGGLEQYCGHPVVATRGIPLVGIYPSLKLNFFRPLFIRRLLEFQPDIIHFVDPIWLSAQAMPACMIFFPNIPKVSSYHTNLPSYASLFGFSRLEPAMWRLIRHLHDRCDVTFCPSASTRDMLQSKGFSNVRLWSRGVDTTLFRPTAYSTAQREGFRSSHDGNERNLSEEIVMLYVGRICRHLGPIPRCAQPTDGLNLAAWEKNLRLLVEAARGFPKDLRFPTAPKPVCRLVFVGDGPAKAAIASLCQHFAIPACFMGHLRGEALAACFASADIFAFPSFTETFGQVVLEAMASGLPIVGLQSEGVRDLVQSGENGVLLDFDDLLPQAPAPTPAAVFAPASPTFSTAVVRYRQLLVDLANDPERRTSMGEASRRRAMTFSWTQAMSTVVDTYYEVRAERRASSSSAASSRNPSPRLAPVGSVALSRVPTLDGIVIEESMQGQSSWASSLAIHASTMMLGRRYGRTPRARPPQTWFRRHDDGERTSAKLEEEELMTDQQIYGFYRSSNLLPRMLIVAVVALQLTIWAANAAFRDVRVAIA